MSYKTGDTLRHIVGYALGICIFLILVPYGLLYLSSLQSNIFKMPIIGNETVRIIISLFLFITGIGFVIWSNIFIVKKGKGGPTAGLGVQISPQTKKLVVTGPYRYTRNPMAFGAYSTYLSIAFYQNSLGCLLILILMIIFIIIYLK